MRSEEWSPLWNEHLYKKKKEQSPSCEDRRKENHLQARKNVLTRHQICCHHHLDFPTTKLWEKNVCSWSHQVYGIYHSSSCWLRYTASSFFSPRVLKLKMDNLQKLHLCMYHSLPAGFWIHGVVVYSKQRKTDLQLLENLGSSVSLSIG